MCPLLRHLHGSNTDEDYSRFVKMLEDNNPKPFDEGTLEHLSPYLDRGIHVVY